MPIQPKQWLESLRRTFSRLGKNARSVVPKKQPKDLTAKHVYQVAKKQFFPSGAQWKHLPDLLSKNGRIVYHSARAVFGLAFLVLLFGIYTSNLVLTPGVGGEYTEGVIGEPQFINPIYATESNADSDLTRLMFRGLFIWDSENGLQPDIAKSVDMSDDQTVYTIELRDDVSWHDGTSLTARDVLFTFQAIRNPEYRSPLEVTFRGVQVEALDDYTVTFTLQEPFAPFLSSLTTGLLPAHIWEGVTPRRANLNTLNLQPVGNGPYRFSRFTKDQTGLIRNYELRRYADFYGETPKIETINMKFYADNNTLLEALANKNVEGIGFAPEDQQEALNRIRGIQVIRPAIPQQVIVFFNDTRNTELADADIREALDLALDREGLIDRVYNDQARVLTSPLLPRTGASIPDTTPQDLDRANELLTEAGWEFIDDSGLRKQENDDDELETLQIELAVVNAPDMLALAEEIQTAWRAVGVDVVVRVDEAQAFQNNTLPERRFDALVTGLLFGADPDPFAFWHSSQTGENGLNLAQYANRKVDEALETARATTIAAERIEAYETFQTLVLEDRPALFLAQPSYTYPTSQKIQGIELSSIVNPSDRFNHVEEWYIRTKKVFKLGKNR